MRRVGPRSTGAGRERFVAGGPAAPAVTRWLVRFGYDGAEFSGWARQPGRRTVEGVIRTGIRPHGLAPSPEAARLEVASRTDRGVSARANALALSSSLDADEVLHRLNALAPDLEFTAAVAVPEEFRVRRALERIYRYFDATGPAGTASVRQACAALHGSIDARTFGRGLPLETPRWLAITSVKESRRGEGRVFEVRAPSFVWGTVRKIVGALREVEAGRLSLPQLKAAAAGRSRLTLPLAEPEGLVLWEVLYPLNWSAFWAGPNRYQAARRREARLHRWVAEAVEEARATPEHGSSS